MRRAVNSKDDIKVNTDTDTPSLAILDSGAGGLCVANEIIGRGLKVDLRYIADLKHFPYGSLSDSVLIERLQYLVAKLHKHTPPDAIIIACNTASTIALPALRSMWKTPFIGVVPAVKPAARLTKKKRIAVLATNATVDRDYLSDLITQHAQDIEVACKGSPELVELAEQSLANTRNDSSIDLNRLKEILEKSLTEKSDNESDKELDIDQLVLACTHFPILKKQIASILNPKGINIVDSTDAIVNRLCSVLPNLEYTESNHQNKHAFVSTANDDLTHYARFVFGNDLANIEFVKNY